MTKKFFTGSIAFAVAAMAIFLVSAVGGGNTATAAINSITASPTTINTAGTSTVSIDADEAAGDVTIIATVGFWTAGVCDAVATDTTAPAACAIQAGSPALGATTTTTILDDDAAVQAGGMDLATLTFTAPTTGGPTTSTLTAIQATSVKSASVTIRGNADKVETSVLRAASTSATTCVGTTQNVVQSTTAAAGNTTGFLCTLVLDSAGNRLPTQTVVYTTSAGTVTGTTDTTSATGARANASTIAAGATGVSGATATITSSAGGKTTTSELKFGGTGATCTIVGDPGTVDVGGASAITLNVMDSTGGPVPDGSATAVVQVNPGQGANAAITNAAPTTTNGAAKTSLIAAIPGNIALAGTSGGATCTGTVVATGAAAPSPTTPPAAGTGTITGATLTPGQLSIGTGNGSLTDLGASAVSQGCTNPVLWLNNPAGGLLGFFPTASLSAPNVAANAAFGAAGYNGGILVDCN